MYKSSRHVNVPSADLLSWVFGNEGGYDPNRPILIDALNPNRAISFSQARTAIYYPLLFLAVIGAGAVFVGSNPAYKVVEFTHLLKTSETTLVIAEPDLLPTVQAATSILGIPDSDVLVFAELERTPEGFDSWRRLFQHGEEDWLRFEDEKVSKQTPACFVSTSGTTGLPKMAVLSHHAWVALNCVIHDPEPKPYEIKR
ncbi:MAG: hypothetical protein M1816_003675 [Peltula sp. TS41687]|nr:MAG: hypothetical protein M1816_003675 [Peltula sp. TS41687]